MIYEDGKIHKGNYQKGIKHGQGEEIEASGDIQEGEWVNGLK